MTEHNLPVPDDMPWVNLTQEEVEELRNKKHELTEYGKEKLKKLMNKESFFKYYFCDYYATGEGWVCWMMIDRNYGDSLRTFKEFIGDDFYFPGIQEMNEQTFMNDYGQLIPEKIKMFVERKDAPGFCWKQQYYFNYA